AAPKFLEELIALFPRFPEIKQILQVAGRNLADKCIDKRTALTGPLARQLFIARRQYHHRHHANQIRVAVQRAVIDKNPFPLAPRIGASHIKTGSDVPLKMSADHKKVRLVVEYVPVAAGNKTAAHA